MRNKWYWAFKYIFFGPLLRVWNRPWSEGMDNIPEQGAAIVASNHQAVMDSFFLPLLCPRQITFLAKEEYFVTPGPVGRAQAWFFTAVGQKPVARTSESAAADMLATAQRILDEGNLFGIYPEGTRSPDGRVYKGRVGMARVAMATGHPVIPVAMVGTREANPIGSWILRPRRVGMRIAKPIDPHEWARQRGLDPQDHATAREFTDALMRTLATLARRDYVDVYASDVKASLAAGQGYPQGAQPRA
ncbi:1-acyl-sn-glycerol-3-phosphate acyltransferase [Corynebacterium lizhenjunii]|uniref:1-acyl-sn-glycerol-3-phosphate acyltransferase n=1 Tax=Corynebacterium lizhenjunii TaxID=2709394 RepID=A0A7T0KDT4_9CORY|nr:lysophospholipid acyltransferase family protein [Corynebacterium lizhenjunii]QPK78521.1 1-acyl-sn-glycerol-3-phosphate acyltransferase [Corynebacterium lizhenjunii]